MAIRKMFTLKRRIRGSPSAGEANIESTATPSFSSIGIPAASSRSSATPPIELRNGVEKFQISLARIQLVLGYVAWLLCFRVYIWPRLKAANRFDAQRAIATLHSFRFFGLVFILPGVVGPGLPAGFDTFAAYGDFATGVLALLALLTARIRPLFWFFVVAFNLVGATDIIVDYYHAIQSGLPAMTGQLGNTYAIAIIYVPLLMITHVVALYFLLLPQKENRYA